MLHHSEWLDLCQKVPVGQKRRVFHGAERTAAMDVFNNPDSWSCYCHRCHKGAIQYKQFIEKPSAVIPDFKKYLDRTKLVSLKALRTHYSEKYKRLVIMLQSKGVSVPLLANLNPMYNLEDDRLVFSIGNVDIGRDCTGNSPAKWYKYPCEGKFIYLQGDSVHCKREPIILCEDLFSCAKITYYTRYSTMCLLGTNFEDAKLQFILEQNAHVVCATDGDDAGHAARRTIRSRCNLHGIPFTAVDVPLGFDPKDLSPLQLKELFHDLSNSTDQSS